MKIRFIYLVIEVDIWLFGVYVFLILLDVSLLILIVNLFLSWFSLDISIFLIFFWVDEFF